MTLRPTRGTRPPRKGWDSGPDCAVCGYKAVNVRHERDPHHAPEGIEYFRPFLSELHDFQTAPPSEKGPVGP